MESKKPTGQVVALAGSSTTESPSLRTKTVDGSRTPFGKRTVCRSPSFVTVAVSMLANVPEIRLKAKFDSPAQNGRRPQGRRSAAVRIGVLKLLRRSLTYDGRRRSAVPTPLRERF